MRHFYLLILALAIFGGAAPAFGQQTAAYSPSFQVSGQSLFETNGGTPAGVDFSKQFLLENDASFFAAVDPGNLGVFVAKAGLGFNAYYKLNELTGGAVDITYPVDVQIQYPDDRSYGCNDWISISTSCSGGNGHNLTVTPPTLEFELGTKTLSGTAFGIGGNTTATPEGFEMADNNNWTSLAAVAENPFFRLNTNDGITWPWTFAGIDDPTGTIPSEFPITIPSFISDYIFLEGTLDNPFAEDGTDSYTNKKLSETSSKTFIDLEFSPLNFQQYITGVPLSASVNLGLASGEFTIFNIPLGMEVEQIQEVSFEGEVDIQFALSQPMQYEERDGTTNAIVNSGTASSTITIKAGNTLRVKYPDGAPVLTAVTPKFVMVNDMMTTKISEEITFSVGIELLSGEITIAAIDEEICVPFTDLCTEIEIDGASFPFAAIDEDLDAPPISFDVYDETFPITDDAFEDITGNSFNLQPDDSAPVASYLSDRTINLSGTEVQVNYDNFLQSFIDADGGGATIPEGQFSTYNCSDLGSPVYAWMGSDNRCNEDDYEVSFTLNDTGVPVAKTKTFDLYLDADGNATLAPEDVNDNSTDNCEVTGLSLSKTTFNCSDVGEQSVTLTVQDAADNMDTEIAVIQVIDTVAPVALCRPALISLDANGMASTTAEAINNGSNDACGIASIALSKTSFSCSNLNANTVTLTVTDNNGNSSTCQSTVTVVDEIMPTPVCIAKTIFLEPDGQYSLILSDVYDPAASFDNCTITQTDFAPTTYTCDEVGGTYAVTVTATDQSGNQSSCDAIISVEIGDALPEGWTGKDVNLSGTPGSYTFDPCTAEQAEDGEYTSTTNAINPTAGPIDRIGFISHSLCGDGSITAKLEEIENGFAGITMRENCDPNARMIALYSNLSTVVRRAARYQTGAPKQSALYAGLPSPWLRLTRTGNVFRAYVSYDSNIYYLKSQLFIPMGQCIEIGLATYASRPGLTATSVFSHVEITGASPASLLQATGPSYEAWSADADVATTMNVYPNPSQGRFTVAFGQPLQQDATLSLTDALGRTLMQQQARSGEVQLDWDASGLPGGLYFIQTSFDGQATTTIRIMLDGTPRP